MQVAKKHFETTLRKQNQPQTMALHMEFPRRTEVGPATFTVKDVKLGRMLSTIHITLSQNGHEAVLAYMTQSNLSTAEGVGLDLDWKLLPATEPVDLIKLKEDKDAKWREQLSMPFAHFRRASGHVVFYYPRAERKYKSLTDYWLRFRNGDRFTNESLGYVSDMFPQIVEIYLSGVDPYSTTAEEWNKIKDKRVAKFWYPTVCLNIDVKKALPEGGVEFLFGRCSSKKVQNGRLDIEIIIMDAQGDIVALSHHVTLVLGAERNLAGRKNGSGKPDAGSKI